MAKQDSHNLNDLRKYWQDNTKALGFDNSKLESKKTSQAKIFAKLSNRSPGTSTPSHNKSQAQLNQTAQQKMRDNTPKTSFKASVVRQL